MISKTWSTEQTKSLIEMVRHTRLTYDEIGERLGKPRGAVCAKVDRLGIGRRAVYSRRPAPPRPTRAAPPLTQDVQRILARHAREASTRQLVQLVDLNDWDCHFVLGDPRESKNVYCGEPAVPGQQYCKGCLSRVYEPIEVVREVKREVAIREEATV